MNHPKLAELQSLLDGALPEAVQLRKLAGIWRELTSREVGILREAVIDLLNERDTIQRAAAVVIKEVDVEFGKLKERIAALRKSMALLTTGKHPDDNWRSEWLQTEAHKALAADNAAAKEKP